MATVETEIVWVGDSGRAEALFAAISPDDPETFEAEILGNGDGTADLKIIVNVRFNCAAVGQRAGTWHWRARLGPPLGDVQRAVVD